MPALGRVPERRVSGSGAGGGDLAVLRHRSLPLQDDGGAAVAGGERAAGAVREREVAILHLHLGMRLAAQLAHRLDHLGEAAAVGRGGCCTARRRRC